MSVSGRLRPPLPQERLHDLAAGVARQRLIDLAERDLGLTGAPAAQLSSFEALPRKGDDVPLTDTPIRQASVTTPTN